eukprot:6839105-Pyramimonas_sp.AAC.1
MTPKRKRRRRASASTSSSSGHRAWENRIDDAGRHADARADAAEKLVGELFILYADGTLTAKSVCTIAHFATEAG